MYQPNLDHLNASDSLILGEGEIFLCSEGSSIVFAFHLHGSCHGSLYRSSWCHGKYNGAWNHIHLMSRVTAWYPIAIVRLKNSSYPGLNNWANTVLTRVPVEVTPIVEVKTTCNKCETNTSKMHHQNGHNFINSLLNRCTIHNIY